MGLVTEEEATYSTGTVSVTNGSTTVTLSGGTFPADIANKGQITLPDGNIYAVASRTDGTTIVLATAYEGSNGSGSFSATYFTATSNASGSYGKSTTWGAGSGDVLSAANFAWKMNL